MELQNCFLSRKLHSYFMVSAFQCLTLNTQQNDTRLDIPRYQLFQKHSIAMDRDRLLTLNKWGWLR